MMIPDQNTGNKKLDTMIAKAIKKDPRWSNSNAPYESLMLIDEDRRNNKYGVSEVEERTYNGIIFDSKHEMERYMQLLLVEAAGEISDVQLQVPFILQEEFISKQHGEIKAIKYVADFVYKNREGRMVVEDAKGMKTVEYKLKRKMFLYRFGEYLFYEV